MRKTTKALASKLQEATAADERLAGKISGFLSFADKLERAIEDRRAEQHKEVDGWADHLLGEMKVLKGEMADMRGELMGEPKVMINHQNQEQIEGAENEEQGTV